MGKVLEALVAWVTDVIYSMGYIGLALLLVLENLFPPIPSEVILPLAGFLVGRGRFSFLLALGAATVGAVVGALILYGLGRWLGERRIRRFVGSYGHYLLLHETDIDKGQQWFTKHGGIAVLVGRLVPGVRSVISLPAGINGMPIGKFVLYTAAGSGIWNAILIGLGWFLGDQWSQVSDYAQVFEYGILGLVTIGVGWFIWKRLRHRSA